MFPVNLPFTSGISQPAMLFPINPYEIPSLVPRIPDDLPRKHPWRGDVGYMEVSIVMGIPKNGLFIMENPVKMDSL